MPPKKTTGKTGKGRKELKEIMNRTHFDKYELEDYMLHDAEF